MKEFLSALLTNGRASVAPLGIPMPWDSKCDELIIEFDRRGRHELAGGAPALRPEVARWAATMLAEICRLAVCRDASPEDIDCILSSACPAPPGDASAIYSADLFFRQLPALARWIERMAPGDPLVQQVARLGTAWPLSSVGMTLAQVGEVDAIMTSDSLRVLYVDRVIEARDLSRLAAPLVREAVRHAIGEFPQLAPEVARAVKEFSEPAASC